MSGGQQVAVIIPPRIYPYFLKLCGDKSRSEIIRELIIRAIEEKLNITFVD